MYIHIDKHATTTDNFHWHWSFLYIFSFFFHYDIHNNHHFSSSYWINFIYLQGIKESEVFGSKSGALAYILFVHYGHLKVLFRLVKHLTDSSLLRWQCQMPAYEMRGICFSMTNNNSYSFYPPPLHFRCFILYRRKNSQNFNYLEN